MGLGPLYRDNLQFKEWVQFVMALPLLPTADIQATWLELCQMHGFRLMDLRKRTLFITYMERTWLSSRLPILSVYGQSSRTNNAVESWNGRFGERVHVAHPNFWEFCEVNQIKLNITGTLICVVIAEIV